MPLLVAFAFGPPRRRTPTAAFSAPTPKDSGERPDCNERTALEWTNRLNKHGFAGLEEARGREGRPRVYGPEAVGAVIQAALTSA